MESPDERRTIRAYAPTTGESKHFADPGLWDKVDRVVKLMPEYSVEIPLWGPWEQLDLSAALLARLREWQEHFDVSFQAETGWLSSTARQSWTGEAEALEVDLRRDVGNRAEVITDLWPIRDD